MRFHLTIPILLVGWLGCLSAQEQEKFNVLFIAIDDLRPALGCYGDPVAQTPHIDRIASRGTLFERAYCQEAVCSPSRQSLITGLRPDTIQVWDLTAHFRKAVPNAVTLPQHFKNHGYHTASIGKILHGGGKPAKDPPSWSEEPLHDVSRDAATRYASADNLALEGHKRSAAEGPDVPDNAYIDGIVCDDALEALERLSEKNQPFFLGVGFRKPHLPFCAPLKYWDLYDRADIPAPVSTTHPIGAPELATRSWQEVEGYIDVPKDTSQLTPEKIQELRHGYYACVSYIDAQVGRLLNQLDSLNLTDKTVICLWGDHGFHLGEQGLWAKANNYELSTRAPLLFAMPGHPNPGTKVDALVEFVDIYPTLASVCGLPKPKGLEGVAMDSLFRNPEQEWKSAAFSQYPRERTSSRHKGHGEIMGYAIRTDRYRYVEWRVWKTGEVEARELYDLKEDPLEMTNLVTRSEKEPLVDDLSMLLAAGWKAALPPHVQGSY